MKVGYESGIGAWYDKLKFEEACGVGSYPINNGEYCQQLIQTLDHLDVRKIIDYGCGNLQTYDGNIDWLKTKYEYVGYDAHIGCINTLKEKYPKLRFHWLKLKTMPEQSDVLVIKDVLIHWFDEDIRWFFNNVFEEHEYVIYMHSTTNQGYQTRIPKREVYMIDNPEHRFGIRKQLPEGAKYWEEGCFGYKCVPSELLPENKIVFKKNIMGDSMKTFILFKR